MLGPVYLRCALNHCCMRNEEVCLTPYALSLICAEGLHAQADHGCNAFGVASVVKQRHGTTYIQECNKTWLRDRLRTTRAETIDILRRALAPQVQPCSRQHSQPCCPREADRHGAPFPKLWPPPYGHFSLLCAEVRVEIGHRRAHRAWAAAQGMTEETLAHIRAQLFNNTLIGLGDATAVPPGCARATLHACTACCRLLSKAWMDTTLLLDHASPALHMLLAAQ